MIDNDHLSLIDILLVNLVYMDIWVLIFSLNVWINKICIYDFLLIKNQNEKVWYEKTNIGTYITLSIIYNTRINIIKIRNQLGRLDHTKGNNDERHVASLKTLPEKYNEIKLR